MTKTKKTKAAAKKKPAAKKKAAPTKKAKKAPAKKKPAAKKKAAKKKTPAKKPATAKKKPAKTKAVKKSVARVTVLKPKKKARKIRLTAKTEKDFRAMLLTMRNQLTGQIAALQGDSLQRQDAVNSEEDGTDAFERQFALNLASSENDEVFEIDEALQRLDQKTYGVCEECSGGIESARLKALPFVRMCIGCQTESEKAKGRFRPRPI